MTRVFSLVTAFALAVTTVTAMAADDKSKETKKETKKVCVDQKDKNGDVVKNKDGTAKQTCKDVVVHKKLEGTEVPNQKK